MSELILKQVSGNIATLTLNRPERHNSLVPELLSDLLSALEALRGERELRALVLQANGRSFSTGGDVRGFYDQRHDIKAYSGRVVGLLNETILALIAFPVPIVAAVHGIVTGGSIGLVLASDIVLVAPEVTFTAFYSTVGFSPDGGWTALLPTLIGAKRAAHALLLDQPITAHEAVEWGLANRIVPADSIREQARILADAIARQKPGSIARVKRLLWGEVDSVAQRLQQEQAQFLQQIISPEAQHGMTTFLGRHN